MSNRRETSLSKIERKIFKNTFMTNSNDLQFREDTKKSQISSRHHSSTSPRTFDISHISQVSNHQIDLIKSFPVQELDFSGISFKMDTEIVKNFQEAIRISAPGSIITLPPKKLQFDSLLITSPITLRGLPGSAIEITNGSIVIDFSGHLKESILDTEKQSAIICEIAFQYTLDSDFRSPAALFVLDACSTKLEVRDCDLKSNNHSLQIVSGDSLEEIDDVCFWINGLGNKKGISKNSLKFNSMVIVSSCNISNFFECARGGINCNICIEKSHIAGCLGNAVSVVNPKQLIIKQSVIDRIQHTAIDVNLIPDYVGINTIRSSGTEALSSMQIEKSLVIEGNDIRSTGSYGINIWSDNVTFYPLVIKIIKNKISNCKKEGIAVRHLNINELKIDSNECSCNQGTGFWLQKVISNKISIEYNKSFDNYSGYGLYVYDTGAKLKKNEFFRNSLGGIMVVGASKGTDTHLSIKNCLIKTNGENGITIMDVLQGVILITGCKINENSHDGIYLLQSRDFFNEKSSKDKVCPDSLPQNALVKLKACEIHNNTFYGLNIVKFKCTIEKIRLSDNQQGNIIIAEDTKSLVTFLDDNKVDVTVQVGQNCIVKEKGTFCGRNKNKCNIF
jgi:Right handed beta helix region